MSCARATLASPLRLLPVALLLACSGCLGPKLVGEKVTSDDQEAMPYYLPKPYLLVTKNFNLVATTKKTTTTTKPDGTKIEVVEEATQSPGADARALAAGKTVYAHQIVYLPDRCNLYGLRVARGIGTLDSQIVFEDGWKFTGTKLRTDSKTPETISAIAEPLAELGAALAGARLGPATLLRAAEANLPEETPEGADVALYDLFSGECQFAWPNRDACPEPPPCEPRE